MIGKKAISVLLCFFYAFSSFAKSIRHVEATEDKVVLINTALGYSTILEFNSRPISAVLGDQDSFKLEYVGNSITLKPLLPHSHSNLFIFTEYDRFNCTLRTVSPSEVDYSVKITAPSKAYPVQPETLPQVPHPVSPSVKTKQIQKKVSWKGYTLQALSSSQVKGSESARSVTVIEFNLSTQHIPYTFSAASFGVKQRGHFIPIESIYLDAVDLNPGHRPVYGKIVLLNQDYHPSEATSLLFAVPHHILQVPLSGGSLKNSKGK